MCDESDFVRFLAKEKEWLDHIIFSGGEPLGQEDLSLAVALAKEQGYQVGIHTSGAFPLALAKLDGMLDYIALDIKAPFNQYQTVTGIASSGERALLSMKIACEMRAVGSVSELEFRTTVFEGINDSYVVLEDLISDLDPCDRFVIQQGKTSLAHEDYQEYLANVSLEKMRLLHLGAKRLLPNCWLRGAAGEER